MKMKRRAFLIGGLGAVTLGAGSYAWLRRWGAAIDPKPGKKPAQLRQQRPFAEALKGPAFDPAALATLTALVDRLLPETDGLPGGVELGVVGYLSRAARLPGLGGLRNAILELTRFLDRLAEKRFGQASFQKLSASEQDSLLQESEKTTQTGGGFDPSRALKVTLRLCLEGYLGHPAHGGNLGGEAWTALRIAMPMNRGPFQLVKAEVLS